MTTFAEIERLFQPLSPENLAWMRSQCRSKRRSKPQTDATCGNDHPWTPETTMAKGSRPRTCRICARESSRQWRANRKAS